MMATEFQILCPPELVVDELIALGGKVETQKELIDALVENQDVARMTAVDGIKRAIEFEFVKATKVGRKVNLEVME